MFKWLARLFGVRKVGIGRPWEEKSRVRLGDGAPIWPTSPKT